MKSIYEVIRRPVITEKSTLMKELDNQVVFEVDARANKHEVREAVEKLFGVKVQSINTIKVPGRPRRFGRTLGRRAGWKKAIVTLRPGQELDLYDMVAEEGVEV